jgi:L-iditol 2-dehydrogenase
MGARRVAVFDIFDERLELAKRLGADAVFNTTREGWMDETMAYTNGNGFSYVFETAGQPATIQIGFHLVCNKGQMTCVGTPHKDLTFGWKEWELLNRKEFRLTGTWMSYSAPFPGKEWELTAHYFGTGDLKLDDSMIFARVPLSECTRAAAMFQTPGLVRGKVLLVNDIS